MQGNDVNGIGARLEMAIVAGASLGGRLDLRTVNKETPGENWSRRAY
jgi:hypothetical protein